MRPGDFILIQSRGFYPWLVRVCTGSKWNHVEIFAGRGMVIGADLKRGVIRRPLDDALAGATASAVFRVRATDEEADIALDEADLLTGSSYDLGGVLGIFVKLLCDRLKIRWVVFWGRNKASDERGFFCSELVAYCYDKVGVRLCEDDPSYITPADLASSGKVFLLDDSGAL